MTTPEEQTPLLDETPPSDAPAKTEGAYHEIHKHAFGQQTITTAGSFILNINNLIGPALVTFPLVYKQAGWFSVTFLLLLISVLTAFSATMMIEAMQRIPGNHLFRRRFEFATVMKHYWGKKGFVVGQILVILCLQASNIASIIVAAQVMDDLLIFAFGHTYGLHFAPPNAGFIASNGSDDSDHPFGKLNWIISLGYIISAAICIPFGYLNLDQNMGFQWFSCIGMCLTILEFLVQFFLLPWNFDYIPIFGNVPGLKSQALVLGTVIFSMAFTITVPSWVNEKKPEVSANKSIWSSTTISTLMKLAFAYLAAITYRNENNSDNILSVMTANAVGALGIVTRISVYLFNASTILPGIPPLSIYCKYNLISGGICGPKLAFFIGVVAPWLVSMFFYTGRGLSSVVNWTAILLQGFVNFVIPVLLYFWALRWYPTDEELVKLGVDRVTYEATHPHAVHEAETTTAEADTAAEKSNEINGEVTKVPKSQHLHNYSHDHPHKNHGFDSVHRNGDHVPHGSINANTSDVEAGSKESDEEEGDESLIKYSKMRAVPCGWINGKALALAFGAILVAGVLATLGLDFYYLIVFHEDVVDG